CLARAQEVAQSRSGARPLNAVTVLAPIPRPRRNIFCLGLNYKAHAQEGADHFGQSMKLPEYPIFFSKPPSSVVGPGADVEVNPNVTQQVDWEVELALVIGRG